MDKRNPSLRPCLANRDNKLIKLGATLPLECFHTGFILSVPNVLLRKLILLSIPIKCMSRNEETTIKGFFVTFD